jgi:hypothetical protein
MRKFLFLTLALGIAAFEGKAQNYRFGAKGGVNYASITGMSPQNIRGRAGLQGGVVFLYGIYQPIGFHVELLYSAKGFSREPVIVSTAPETVRTHSRDRYHYFDLPLLFKVKRGPFFFQAGPKVSYLFRARTETSIVVSRANQPDEAIQMDHSILGSLNRIDYGAAAGLGFMINEELDVSLLYNAGLRRIRKDTPQNPYDIADTSRNTFFQFAVSYYLPTHFP